MEVKPGYKQTEVGVIPEDWDVKKLGAVVEKFVNGGTPSTKNENYWTGNIPWITGADILNQKVADVRRHITKEAVKCSSTNVIGKGNLLLVSRTGVGKLAIAPFDIAISQDFTGVYVREDTLIPEYLYRYFDFNQAVLQGQNQGTSIKGITRDTLSAICIPLPPTKAEQRAIAEALGNADALLATLEKLIAKKRDLKQGAMQQLLTGKKRLPGFIGEWSSRVMSDVCWFQEGPGVRNTQFTSSGIKLLNGTNIFRGRINLDTTDRFISLMEAHGPYAHFLADAGDIVIACSGISIDKFHEKVAVVTEAHLPFCMNTSTMRFKPHHDSLLSPYLYHFLMSEIFKSQIGSQATGSAQLNFGPSHVANVTLLLPELAEQTAIAGVLSDMDAELAVLEQRLAKTRALKQGMMQELLTGKTRLI